MCRRLVDAGAHVSRCSPTARCTSSGAPPSTRSAPSRPGPRSGTSPHPIPHTHLGQAADLVLVAPATARLLGLYAAGISDDLLTNACSPPGPRSSCAPAMHTEMWEHPAVQDNLASCSARGVHVVEPEVGPPRRRRRRRRPPGRPGAASWPRSTRCSAAAEPRDLAGLRVLVTAGGTREPIDPVRFIGNRSLGQAGPRRRRRGGRPRRQGHPRHHRRPRPSPPASRSCGSRPRPRWSDAVLEPQPTHADVVVMAAAVADFRPVAVADRQDQEGGRRPRGACSSPPPTSSPPSAPQRRPGQIDRRLRRRDRRPARQRRRQAGPQGRRPHRRQRRLGARRRASSTTPTRW